MVTLSRRMRSCLYLLATSEDYLLSKRGSDPVARPATYPVKLIKMLFVDPRKAE